MLMHMCSQAFKHAGQGRAGILHVNVLKAQIEKLMKGDLVLGSFYYFELLCWQVGIRNVSCIGNQAGTYIKHQGED